MSYVFRFGIAPALVLVGLTSICDAETFTPGSPRAVAESLGSALAAADAQAIRTLLIADAASQREMVDAMVHMSAAIVHLRDVAATRYGAVNAKIISGDPAGAANEQHKRLEAALLTTEGDAATLTFADPASDPIRLKRSSAGWRILLSSSAEGLSDPEVLERAQDLEATAKVLDGVSAECESGRWATANDVLVNVQKRVTKSQQSRLPATGPTTAPTSQAAGR